MNLNVTTGTNPIDSAVRTYGALQGIRLADEEVALKKQGMANEQSNREAMLKIAQEDSALRQTQGQQATTKFGQDQLDYQNNQDQNALRMIQYKMKANKANKRNGMDGITPEERALIEKTPEGRDYMSNYELVGKKKVYLDKFTEAANKHDGYGAAEQANMLWPEQFNRGPDKMNNGMDIKDVVKPYQDPASPPGFVRIDANGAVMVPGSSGYAEGQPVQLGKRAHEFKLNEDGSKYTVSIQTTTIDPATGQIYQYVAPMTEGRIPNAPEAWKPTEKLVGEVLTQEAMIDFAEQHAIRTGNKSAIALQDQEAEFTQKERQRRSTLPGQAQDAEAKTKIAATKASPYVTAILRGANVKNTEEGMANALAAMEKDPSWAGFKDPELQSAVRAELDKHFKGGLADDKTKSEIEVHKSTVRKNDAEISRSKAEGQRTVEALKYAGSREAARIKSAEHELDSASKAWSSANDDYLKASMAVNAVPTATVKEYKDIRDAAKKRLDEAKKNRDDEVNSVLMGQSGSGAPAPVKQDASALSGIGAVMGSPAAQQSAPSASQKPAPSALGGESAWSPESASARGNMSAGESYAAKMLKSK